MWDKEPTDREDDDYRPTPDQESVLVNGLILRIWPIIAEHAGRHGMSDELVAAALDCISIRYRTRKEDP